MPLVSVVIPTHNRPEALQRAVQSVLDQTLSDFELLVVNDHPAEEPVLDVLRGMYDQRIRYLRNEKTKGGSGARNTGLVHAKGRYIALLDDDDEWVPQKIEKQIQKMQILPDSWGGCYCGFMRRKKSAWEYYPDLKEGFILKDYYFSNNPVCIGSTFLFRKKGLRRFGYFDEEMERHQDTLFLVYFLRHYKLAFVNGILAKINGHHPAPAQRLERAKLRLIEKMKPETAGFSLAEKRAFYASEYYTLARYFSSEGHVRKSLLYVTRSMFYRLLKPSKIVRIAVNLFKAHKKNTWNPLPR